jgi:hypothetical protein
MSWTYTHQTRTETGSGEWNHLSIPNDPEMSKIDTISG